MTASKLNREWDPFTLAEGIANSDLNDKAEKIITQYNRKIKVFHPDLVLTGKVAIASAETHVFDVLFGSSSCYSYFSSSYYLLRSPHFGSLPAQLQISPIFW